MSFKDTFSDFVSKKLQLPLTLLPGIIGFVAAQIFLHLFYCCFVWAVTQLIANLLRLSAQQTFTFGIIVWFLGLATILAANCYYFPNSKFPKTLIECYLRNSSPFLSSSLLSATATRSGATSLGE